VTAARPGGVRRRILHPLAPTLVLLALALAGTAAALRGTAASGALLGCAAGCAAGFANSGST
jgi:hypothetical protein